MYIMNEPGNITVEDVCLVRFTDESLQTSGISPSNVHVQGCKEHRNESDIYH